MIVLPSPDRGGVDSAQVFDPWQRRWTREGMLIHDYMYYEEAEKNLIDKNLLKTFYGVDKVGASTIPNYQMLDLAGLKGRIQSISYVPDSGSEHKRIMDEIKDVFEKNNNGGMVKIEYTTRVFYGKLK